LPRCDSDKDSLTTAASHELTEAATDPYPEYGSMGYDLIKKSPWNPAGGEIADLCEFVSGVPEGSYTVTRAWSNENAKLGQQPCVPVPTDNADIPYFNAGIVNELQTAKAGDTLTTEVDCYSFGPLPNDLTLQTQANSSNILTFEFDKPTC